MDQETLNEFKQSRDYLLYYLNYDPRTFAATLYTETPTGPVWNRKIDTYSPYLPISTSSLCCLIGASGQQIKPNICLYSTIKPLAKGKEGETILISGPSEEDQKFVLKIFIVDKVETKFFEQAIT